MVVVMPVRPVVMSARPVVMSARPVVVATSAAEVVAIVPARVVCDRVLAIAVITMVAVRRVLVNVAISGAPIHVVPNPQPMPCQVI